jgi:CBS domain-containing protein
MVSDRDLRWAEGRALDPATPVEDLMSDFVVTVEPRTQLSLAAQRMLEHRFGALAVVDEGKLVGILTSSDLLEHCLDALWRD